MYQRVSVAQQRLCALLAAGVSSASQCTHGRQSTEGAEASRRCWCARQQHHQHATLRRGGAPPHRASRRRAGNTHSNVSVRPQVAAERSWSEPTRRTQGGGYLGHRFIDAGTAGTRSVSDARANACARARRSVRCTRTRCARRTPGVRAGHTGLRVRRRLRGAEAQQPHTVGV